MVWWMVEGLDEKERFSAIAKLEVPPKGYTGSLTGTSWDPGVVLSEYQQAEGNIRKGGT